MAKYAIRVFGDDIVTGPAVELNAEQLDLLKQLFGEKLRLVGDYTAARVVNISEEEEQRASYLRKLAEEKRAEEEKRKSFLSETTYSTSSTAMKVAFEEAMKKKGK